MWAGVDQAYNAKPTRVEAAVQGVLPKEVKEPTGLNSVAASLGLQGRLLWNPERVMNRLATTRKPKTNTNTTTLHIHCVCRARVVRAHARTSF